MTGSRLLGEDLRRRRGHRSLEEVARLSKSPPFCDRVEPIAYSTLSMLERGLTMPSAQSLLTLSVLYQVPVEHFTDLIGLERYHARKPDDLDPAILEREIVDHLRTGLHADALAKSLRCLDLVAFGNGNGNGAFAHGAGDAGRLGKAAAVRIYSGIALWKLGWLTQAATTFRDVVDELDVPEELRGWAYQNLVEVERAQGRPASAHAYARDGLDLAERASSRRLQGTFHATLANLKRDLAEQARSEESRTALLDAAMAHHARAQELALECQDEFLLANDLLNEACTLAVAGREARARQRLDQGMELAERAGFRRLKAFGWLERGRQFLAAGAAERAREVLWRSEREASALEATDILFLDYFYLIKAAEALGDESQHAYRKCLSLRSLQQGRFRELAEFEAMQSRREAVS